MSGDLLELLLAAIETPERLTDFAHALRVDIGADAALVRFINTRTWRFPFTAVSGSPPFTAEFFDLYDNKYARIDAHSRVAMRKMLPRGYIYFCHEHYPATERRNDAYFQFLAMHDIAWTAGYMAQLSECEAVAICAVRAPDKAPFGDQERDRLCPVAYHLGQWGKAFWFARRAAAGASAARRALELGAGHVVCIDDEKRPLWEQGAGDLQSIGLERFDGRIRGVSKACERLLAVAVARSIAAPAGPVETVRLKRGEVRVCGDGGALEPHVALLCWQSRRVIAAPVQASKAEQQTIALLVSGLSPEEIARRRDVKVSTVRTQIKRLYRKLGVHSVAQLLAKVNPA